MINANGSMSAPALVKSLKATNGIEVTERTANRMINEQRGKGEAANTRQYQLLHSYLEILGKDNGNIVDCEVSV